MRGTREPMATPPNHLIDARSAMATLGVKAQTLYAYVSRGLIRSVKPDSRKASLYYREDVEALQMRGRTRKATDNAAQRALRIGGGAVMQTAITELTPDGPRYRGQLAVDLAAAGRSFEQCVELLWSGLMPPSAPPWEAPVAGRLFALHARLACASAPANSSRRVLALLVEAWAACLGFGPELSAGPPSIAGRNLVQVISGAIGLLRATPSFNPMRAGESIAQGLARSLGAPASADSVRALDAALVLCADHELAPATFAARVAASAGADIHSCVSSALGAFEGIATGLGCDLAEKLIRDAASPKAYVEMLAQAARRKETLPGYNHPIYPAGDPRARLLIEIAGDGRRSAAATRALQCLKAAHEELGARPSIAVGLSVLALAYGHPPRTPGALMALGRCAGWIAHAHEQRMAGFLVRPRAKYVGLGP